ncbi:MAG: hypothetical protein ABIW76_24385 [Fibrobacteria bacterium]
MKTSTCFVFLASLLFTTHSRADWIPMAALPPADSGYGMPVSALTRAGNALFAALPVGLMKSIDSGKSWTASPSSPFPILGLASNGDDLFCADETGLFLSKDGGAIWRRVLDDRFGGDFRMRQDHDLLVVGAYEDRLWFSRDSGSTWTARRHTPQSMTVLAFTGSKNSLIIGTEGGTFASKDGGATWTPSTEEGNSGRVIALTTLGDSVFLMNENQGLLLSADQGGTWKNVGPAYSYEDSLGFGGYSFGKVQSLQGRLFVAGLYEVYSVPAPSGIFMSADGGLTWKPSNTGLPVFPTFQHADGSTVLAVGNTLLAATASGVFASTDLGASWHLSSKGLPLKALEGLTNYDIHAFGPSIYLVVKEPRFENMSIYRSNDEGKNWALVEIGIKDRIWNIERDGVTGFAMVSGSSDALMMTADGGSHWTSFPGPWSETGGVTAFHLSGSDLFVASGTYDTHRLWHSPDRGKTWIVDESVEKLFRAEAKAGSNRIKTGPNGYALSFSPDEGMTWTQLPDLPANIRVVDLLFHGNRLMALTDSGVIYSDDLAKTWHRTAVPDPQALIREGDFLYAGTRLGLYVSKDGSAWLPFDGKGMAGFDTKAIAVIGRNVAVSRADAIFHSEDLGGHWTRARSGPKGAIALAALPDGAFFSATHDTVYRSTDGGDTWIRLPKLVAGSWQPRIHSLAAGPDRVYVGASTGLFATTDGTAWTFATNRGVRETGNGLAFADGKLFGVDLSNSVRQSGDSGKTWSFEAAMPGPGYGFLSGRGPDLVMASQTKVYSRSAGSTDWEAQSEGMPVGPVTATAVDGGRVFAAFFGLDQDIWWKTLGSATRAPEPVSSRFGFRVATSGATQRFHFRLDSPASVQVSLFDSRGRRLARLASAGKLSGEQTLTWMGAASSLVFYQAEIRSGNALLMSRHGVLGPASGN